MMVMSNKCIVFLIDTIIGILEMHNQKRDKKYQPKQRCTKNPLFAAGPIVYRTSPNYLKRHNLAKTTRDMNRR